MIRIKWRALAGAEAYSYVSTKYRIRYYDHQQHRFGVMRSKDGKWWS